MRWQLGMQPINEGCDLSGKATLRIVITLNMSKLLEYMNHARTNERKKPRQDMYTAKSSYIWNAKILDITIYMNFKKTYRISSIGADRTFRDFAVYMSCLEVRVIGLPIRMTSMFFLYTFFIYKYTVLPNIYHIVHRDPGHKQRACDNWPLYQHFKFLFRLSATKHTGG